MTTDADAECVRPGVFHRLALVTDDGAAMVAWLERWFGARRRRPGSYQVNGLPFEGSATDRATSDESGATSEILWIGNTPVCVLVATRPDGLLGRYVERFGTGMHSLAWTVDDLWGADALLRAHGVRITGVDITGRHFFLHPRDTAGVLIELTDFAFLDDPRDHKDDNPPSGVPGESEIVWTTSVVADLDVAVAALRRSFELRTVVDSRVGSCDCCATRFVAIGDSTLQLATALTPESPFAGAAVDRLHSFAVSTPAALPDDTGQPHAGAVWYHSGPVPVQRVLTG